MTGGAVMSSVQTPGVFFANARPQPVKDPRILAWSDDVASLLDLPTEASLNSDKSQKLLLADVFGGNKITEGMQPIATRYGGHQFGTWAGQLGDGRAILLGEIRNNRGESWEIQLKGAGRTAYSRHADGRAVLRSSLREFICSEAMYYLGVPTTRALCCVTTGSDVVRDMFYDGHPEAEPGAITTRVAPSFLRFGHFEILAASGETENLKQLLRHTIQTYYPECIRGADALSDESILVWFQEVIKRTALLVTEWLRVGFVHGVLNTDNMSILGLTIDYGPYGWLDSFDPTWTPNTTDFERRRYRFEQQPGIGLWNLTRLGEALSTVVADPSALETALQSYIEIFQTAYRDMRRAKIGLIQTYDPDGALLDELDQALVSTEIDMTIFYRKLADVLTLNAADAANPEYLLNMFRDALYAERPTIDGSKKWTAWIGRYHQRVLDDSQILSEMRQKMNQVNPVFVPRNYQVQEVLDDLAKGNETSLRQMMVALKQPYEMNADTERWFRRRPEWARKRPGCSALSCSS